MRLSSSNYTPPGTPIATHPVRPVQAESRPRLALTVNPPPPECIEAAYLGSDTRNRPHHLPAGTGPANFSRSQKLVGVVKHSVMSEVSRFTLSILLPACLALVVWGFVSNTTAPEIIVYQSGSKLPSLRIESSMIVGGSGTSITSRKGGPLSIRTTPGVVNQATSISLKVSDVYIAKGAELTFEPGVLDVTIEAEKDINLFGRVSLPGGRVRFISNTGNAMVSSIDVSGTSGHAGAGGGGGDGGAGGGINPSATPSGGFLKGAGGYGGLGAAIPGSTMINGSGKDQSGSSPGNPVFATSSVSLSVVTCPHTTGGTPTTSKSSKGGVGGSNGTAGVDSAGVRHTDQFGTSVSLVNPGPVFGNVWIGSNPQSAGAGSGGTSGCSYTIPKVGVLSVTAYQTGGAGGGGGGGGGYASVVALQGNVDIPSTATVTADGGSGGDGAKGDLPQQNSAAGFGGDGGAGGGGGAGGFVVIQGLSH